MQRININTLYNYVAFLAGKDIAGGFIPPDRWNEMIPILVNQMVRKYFGIPEQYQPGAPMPAIAYEITSLVTDYLSQFKVELPYTVPDNGVITKPPNYLHKSSIAVSYLQLDPETPNVVDEAKCCGNATTQKAHQRFANPKYYHQWVPVTIVSENERWSWLNSSLRKPTLEDPIAVFLGDDTIQFYPFDIKSALLTYIRYPEKPIWNYTIQGGLPVYNAVGSVDIELPDICAEEMAATILDRLGLTIREPGLTDWARFTKQSGQ